LLLLFGIAYLAEYLRRRNLNLIRSPYIYALSLTVYCTAWTYYGSVGRASLQGMEFLAIYIGPTLAAFIFVPVLGKIIQISKTHRITSIADLLSVRYGKNFSIGIVVTCLCFIGVTPYMALQLKAISNSLHLVSGSGIEQIPLSRFFVDDTFYISLILTFFIILFGTRSIDASEQHEGLVVAVGFEAVVKLIAFLAAGIVIVYSFSGGLTHLFDMAAKSDITKSLLQLNTTENYGSWLILIVVSMWAVVFLPRQFQVAVVENVNTRYLRKATWLFPLYLFLINLFVLPIALAGKLFQPATADADFYVLSFFSGTEHNWLGLFVFIGGFSAATSMIIVETIALSTMLSNNIFTPLYLWGFRFKNTHQSSHTGVIKMIRRISMILIVIAAYVYYKLIAQNHSLVTIGLISFVAVAQFAPAVIGGLYWKGASKNGAIASILIGFAIWFYTLVIPSIIQSEIISSEIMDAGFMGIDWLKPFSLFYMESLTPIPHAAFWSLLFNTLTFVVVSVLSKKGSMEVYQAELFVDSNRHHGRNTIWRGEALMPDVSSLLENFIGPQRAKNLISNYAQRHNISLNSRRADPRIVTFVENILSGVIGAAAARIMVQSISKEEELRLDEVLHILRESQQMMELNKELRKKSTELQRATDQLKSANEQLRNLDEMKDEFLYTVTHELRTPITSIRAMAEILHDNPEMEEAQRVEFLGAMMKESERISYLITQVLSLERYESGRQKLNQESTDIQKVIQDTIESLRGLQLEKNIKSNFIRLTVCCWCVAIKT
jgi:Na+/proline symporter